MNHDQDIGKEALILAVKQSVEDKHDHCGYEMVKLLIENNVKPCDQVLKHVNDNNVQESVKQLLYKPL